MGKYTVQKDETTPKEIKKKYDWSEISILYFSGSNINELSEKFGFNLRYWYRKYYPTWKPIRDKIIKDAESSLYDCFVNEDIDKKEKLKLIKLTNKTLKIIRKALIDIN